MQQSEDLYKPNSLRTYTGRYINLLSPAPETIFPVDIAIGLSRQCRFGGHTKKFYSVAEHSMQCLEMALFEYNHLPYLPLKVLLHDAHEFILGDVPTPLKKLLTEYEYIAQRLQNTIHYRFGVKITPDEEKAIKEIDKKVLEWEWQNKVLKHSGFPYDEQAVADLWLHHFVKHCKEAHVLQ